MLKSTVNFSIISAAIMSSASAMVVISEFEPNPAGVDPATVSFEIAGGVPNAAFDLWVLSLENDGFAGTVDRASNITGNYDANGLAVAIIDDLENPSFTVLLTDAFTGAVGDDLDSADDGTIDQTSLGTILDAVAVSDTARDDATLYGASLGGTDILFNGEFEPLNVFRSASTGNWYQTVTIDFGDPSERIAVFSANGGPEIPNLIFNADPTTTTFGAINPAVPEPSSALLSGLALLGLVRRHR